MRLPVSIVGRLPLFTETTEESIAAMSATLHIGMGHEDQETSLTTQTDYYRKKILVHPGWKLVVIYADQTLFDLIQDIAE